MAEIDNTKDLTKFKALSFDCYGTLIEWEPGLIEALQPITSKLPADHPFAMDPKLALTRFDEFSNELEATQPTLRYDLNLTTALRKLAADVGLPEDALSRGDLDAIATGPGRWPAFGDTVEGLRVLKKHYKLIILSNIDNANIQATTSGPLGAVPFDAVYTAEDIGSYKPAPENFEYLFRRAGEELGIKNAGRPGEEGGELLHVARSLRVDHSAAKALGFSSCWISRGGERKDGQGIGGDYEEMVREGKVSFQWRFDTLGDFAREVARQFGDE
ncbi:haloacid dehalogenase, type II [Diaporthe helianthi]|uniref:Haloacid dehalogenase, type II n=1 Tax=Diaporthe helianthi TaxID=158607 RepID=A0A2P5I8R7_DIAHE|nr:haloacid dehalogenase, type II [Diaporthe helianthi]